MQRLDDRVPDRLERFGSGRYRWVHSHVVVRSDDRPDGGGFSVQDAAGPDRRTAGKTKATTTTPAGSTATGVPGNNRNSR